MTATATRPRRDPRLAARRAEVVRDAGQRRMSVLCALAIAAALVITLIVLAHSSLFSARHVTVVGNLHTSAAAIERAGGLARHPALLDVGAANARRIEALPWIATARISRSFPDSVTVRVTERTPIARVALGGGASALIDGTGRVLADRRGGAKVRDGLVELTGIGPVPAPGRTLVGAALAVLRCAAALPKSLEPRVVALLSSESRGVVVHLTTGASADLGTATGLSEKYVALATLFDKGVLRKGVVADLRVPASPVLNT